DILLINREDGFLETTRDLLRKAGYSVITAMDMRGALTALQSDAVKLIICDNALQDVSGYDFLRYIKNDPLRDAIPFVFFVPVNDQGHAFKAFELGAKDFLVYPMDGKDFTNRIRDIITPPEQPSETPEEGPKKKDAPKKQYGEIEIDLDDQRQGGRLQPHPHLDVEVSRDGMLWMPGKIGDFSEEGMFLETPLLAKPGASLQIRISMSNNQYIINGEIKHLSFGSQNQSAGIGIEIENTQEWQTAYSYLSSAIGSAGEQGKERKENLGVESSGQIEETVMMTREDYQAVLSKPPPDEPEEEQSLDSKFYRSLIGKELDTYKALSFIGAGNMGGVFKGWDMSLEREVALKIISYDLSSQEKFREMFIKEARFISKLDHPNIAHIYYIGNTNDILFYAMEFINGQTFLDFIQKGKNLNTLKGLSYFVTICEGLDFVSKQNIIHRDIKPENIMINDKGILKIVDFGVAQVVDANKGEAKHEGIVGSPLYISPDCIEGISLDHRSDIYSLGATFYHAFTGSPPYEGDNYEEVLMKHLNGNLTPLKQKNPKISNALGSIVQKMMSRKPDDRYQNYPEIIEDLQALRNRALKFQRLKNATLIFRVKNNKVMTPKPA
ncbi:protein kinase, partial [Thermodesulfobacteriota bacterium]